MEQRNSSVRDRLLGRLPQPENLKAYQEETESQLAKHEKAMATELWTNRVLSLCAVFLFLLANSIWGPNAHPAWGLKLTQTTIITCDVMAGVLFFLVQLYELQRFIYGNQVKLLKEVKQVQLQVLELQASLRKDGDLSR
jgi:p-aminobenzoyl-glutamate transporter AbgT